MSRKETYKFYVKSKLDRETDEYKTKVKVKGDYFEALMFALEEVITSLIYDCKLNKKAFLKSMGNTYDILYKGENRK